MECFRIFHYCHTDKIIFAHSTFVQEAENWPKRMIRCFFSSILLNSEGIEVFSGYTSLQPIAIPIRNILHYSNMWK